ncbi:NAD(P)-binding domain-containing protein [Pseudomonas sp. GD03842]|uniref:pyrroline-5-carboxylate reductase family protein n=1 Tax=unclassified Pseudomonas TaxID=196821 RepID=UPI000D387C40|nr:MULTISPECIES: pyrroline-5-carboxylate reductase dimerization domain-containing protein [unclassified Pseudomonas]MDH0749803.1 NAD(P)-binding domain-containing protein [Pseudomonas sp. GD03842]RAU49273.1 pyrroline-5-carboxylate reductase [Pseudomonas sp. RIT 409]RAU55986.1 pyrroline-5-carboxylate reductase [Pseudomonas sp. RIT 412]
MNAERIGIIGGTGWLGGALAQALLDSGFVEADRLWLSNRSGTHPLQATGAHLVADSQALVEACDVVVISVRPEQFKALQIDASGKLVISLMAGVTSQAISEATGAEVVVRAMANAAVEIRQSFTPWHCPQPLSASDVDFVQRLLECVGTASRVPTEEGIDYLSALSGTGPAFPALLMTALTRQAMIAGIPEDVARQAAHGVVVSASRLLVNHEPQALIDSLVAYKGVTAAALQRLMDDGFEAQVGKAVAAGAEVARNGL